MVTTDAITAMKLMATDKKKRIALAKDSTCVGGLIIVLSNADDNIVKQALETLLLLCETHEACLVLKAHVGIMDQIQRLLVQRSTSVGEITNLASQLYEKLSQTKESMQMPLRDSSNLPRNTNLKNQSLQQDKPRAKSIVLQIRGLHDKSDRDLCCRLLLKVKGVISVTFDLNTKRCILRTKPDVKIEDLVASIARSMTMIAQQVIRNENGDESFLSFNTSGGCSEQGEREKADLPDYLSDDSDVSIIDDRALKRPSEEDKKKSAGWFSVAANFLTSSFYW